MRSVVSNMIKMCNILQRFQCSSCFAIIPLLIDMCLLPCEKVKQFQKKGSFPSLLIQGTSSKRHILSYIYDFLMYNEVNIYCMSTHAITI